MKSFLAFLFIVIFFPLHAQNYQLEQVAVSAYEKVIKRAGKVAFKRRLKLSFKSSGYLNKLVVDEGDFISHHQLLAALDTKELKAQKNSRYALLLQAKREVNRIAKLITQKLSSQQQLDIAQTHLETTREAYRVAYYNLEKAEINSPFDGIVLAKLTEFNEFQKPGKPVVEIAAVDNNMVVKVGLTDNEISLVTLGQEVQVQLPNIGKLDGVISKVPLAINTDGQLYLIEILLTGLKAGKGVVAGQLAQVNITFSNNSFVYKVPISALIEIDNVGSAVLLMKSVAGKFVRQSFRLLNLDNHYIYLNADAQSNALSIVTNGWQQFDISGQ